MHAFDLLHRVALGDGYDMGGLLDGPAKPERRTIHEMHEFVHDDFISGVWVFTLSGYHRTASPEPRLGQPFALQRLKGRALGVGGQPEKFQKRPVQLAAPREARHPERSK